MDRRDKGLIPYGGKPCVSYAIELLRPLCRQLFVSANRNMERYQAMGVDAVFGDLRENSAGPLAGIEAASAHIRSDAVLLLPCDLPCLSPEVPTRLLAHLEQTPDLDVAYAESADGGHYLCAALRRSCLASVSGQLESSRHSMRGWYASVNALPVYFEGELSGEFRNFNSSDDFSGEDIRRG